MATAVAPLYPSEKCFLRAYCSKCCYLSCVYPFEDDGGDDELFGDAGEAQYRTERQAKLFEAMPPGSLIHES